MTSQNTPALTHTEASLTSKDGLKLYYQAWIPTAETRASVLLVHGLGEHSARYGHVAEAFTRAGLALHAIDLRGHGRSEGALGHTPSYAHFLDDIDLLADQADASKPIFLYGHSMGGNLVLNYGLHRPQRLTGVICSAAWLHLPNPPQGFMLFMAKFMANVYPAFTQNNGLDAHDLSHDKAVVQAYINDPLVHPKITAGSAIGIMNAAEECLQNAADFKLPLLLMHGSEDKATSPTGTKEFSARTGSSDKTLKIWQGMFHEMHNEIGQADVLALMVDWLTQRS